MSMPESTDLTIRRYRAGDGERVRELNREAMAETPEWVVDAPDTDLDDVRDHYLEAGGEFLVGEVDRRETSNGERGGTIREPDCEIVATGAVEPLDGWMADRFDAAAGTGELSRVRVDPAMQGRGFGTRIVEELARRARRRGYRALVLNTGADNEQARGFYESLGYACVREETVEFDDVTLDLALYWRRVEG
ncbi:GNAT family N-acetyltransferase [Halosimplex litoreum]|uniref:GNAT family N-acetyltransferase n=1 Tax=Halosimplex litoreum TaxID=1198301 RepID=A0A7T3FWP8_9EURY|nr:GNAT family N-acetyltransferase [Halosimplex litoreum]QPV62090.1 GNAT family N-acetyltransferase [Halosimplex litoreum]